MQRAPLNDDGGLARLPLHSCVGVHGGRALAVGREAGLHHRVVAAASRLDVGGLRLARGCARTRSWLLIERGGVGRYEHAGGRRLNRGGATALYGWWWRWRSDGAESR